MSTNGVICKVYGKERKFKTREEAKKFFLEAMMSSDGCEKERYCDIYCQLEEGYTYCSDED